MKWIELAVYTTDEGIELVLGALCSVGIEQALIEESAERIEKHLRVEAPNWDYADAASLAPQGGPCVKAYIADVPENEWLIGQVCVAIERLKQMDIPLGLGTLALEQNRLDEEDWANSWKRYYKPMQIGERLLVCPSWEKEKLTAEQAKGRVVLELDPGMVFGTGAHHTTRMCLELIEKTVKQGDRVLDLGCGSGILAIAAILLGASEAVCVDIDPVAERVVRSNMAKNGVAEHSAHVYIGNILYDEGLRETIVGNYDIVLANIVADVVIALCPLAKNWASNAFICSGIIDEREEEVKAALAGAGFALIETVRAVDDPGTGQKPSEWLAFFAHGAGV